MRPADLTVEAAHRKAHETNGTWVQVHIPKELSYESCEELYECIADIAMNWGDKDSADVLVMGHRSPGCGVPGHPVENYEP